MIVVLTISICLNVFQALIFWFFMVAFYQDYEKRKEAENETN